MGKGDGVPNAEQDEGLARVGRFAKVEQLLAMPLPALKAGASTHDRPRARCYSVTTCRKIFLCGLPVQRDYVSTCFQLVQIIGPLLHHLPTFNQMRSSVVCAPIWISYGVS